MYLPKHFRADDEQARELLSGIRRADLVSSTSEGLFATFLPLIYDEHAGEHGALLGHVARKNDHWRLGAIGEALVIAHGPDAYITPSWYPSKREHGRVVPTWNYIAVHVAGAARLFDDTPSLIRHLSELTDSHESGFAEPWSVTDAPPDYVANMTRAIVGIEIAVDRIEGKWK